MLTDAEARYKALRMMIALTLGQDEALLAECHELRIKLGGKRRANA